MAWCVDSLELDELVLNCVVVATIELKLLTLYDILNVVELTAILWRLITRFLEVRVLLEEFSFVFAAIEVLVNLGWLFLAMLLQEVENVVEATNVIRMRVSD